jgi:hypothetical protein
MLTKTYKHLPVKADTIELINECEILYRVSHPELKDYKISRDKMLKLICEYYLR